MLKTKLLLGVLFGLASLSALRAAQPSVTRWVPADAALAVEINQPAMLLDPLTGPQGAKALAAFPLGEEQKLKLQQLQGIVAFLELQLGTNWRSGLNGLVGEGMALAVEPSGGVLVAADARDEKLLGKLHETVRSFAAGSKGEHPERASAKDYRGTATWSFGPNKAHALLGNRLLLANRPELLERALDLRADARSSSLAENSFYQQARKAVGEDAVATVFVNMRALRQLPKVKEALAGNANPLGTLLLTDIRESLRNANWVAIGVRVDHGQLHLNFLTDGEATAGSKCAGFASPAPPQEGPRPGLLVPGRIASVSLYRDLGRFYAAKDDLFPERTSGLVFFENMMGIFFSGKELTDGVLGQVLPDLRLVVAEQRYEPAVGIPAVQVPAFAAVLRLRQPGQFSETVEEAWQKALGLVNFTRGQKALPGLVLDRTTHDGVTYSFSYYRSPERTNSAPVDARYNYRPSLARFGDFVVLSSTDGLACDLIDQLKKESATPIKPLTGGHSFAELDGASLRSVLAANVESLVQKNMVEKGHTREQAEAEVRTLLTLLDCIDRAALTVHRAQGHPQAALELRLKPPSAAGTRPTALLSK